MSVTTYTWRSTMLDTPSNSIRDAVQSIIDVGRLGGGVVMQVAGDGNDDLSSRDVLCEWYRVLNDAATHRWPLVIEHAQDDVKIEVEMHAFRSGGSVIRRVLLTPDVLRSSARGMESRMDDALLRVTWMYGQNYVQPLPMRSVSIDDIIRIPLHSLGARMLRCDDSDHADHARNARGWCVTRYLVRRADFERVPNVETPHV